MIGQWSEQGAREACDRWASKYGEAVALRVYSGRLIGADPTLVLHGGGNVSVKARARTRSGEEVDALYIKATGCDLAALEPDSLSAVNLTAVGGLRGPGDLDESTYRSKLRRSILDSFAPNPSVETPVHAFLPYRFIDHSQPDVVLALTDQADGGRAVLEAFGNQCSVVPYVESGPSLAEAVASAVAMKRDASVVILMHHGLIVFAEGARAVYERHMAAVDACRSYIDRRKKRRLTISYGSPETPQIWAKRVIPLIKELVLDHVTGVRGADKRVAVEWRAPPDAIRFVNSVEGPELVLRGPISAQHVQYNGPWPLFVSHSKWESEGLFRAQLSDALDRYSERARRSCRANALDGRLVPTVPRVLMVPGAGLFCWGWTPQEAVVSADLADHALWVIECAHAIGEYSALPPKYWYSSTYRQHQR